MRMPTSKEMRGSSRKMTPKRRRLLVRTYLPDWAMTILLWGLFYLLDKVDGFRRSFDINDTSLHHTYSTHTRVSSLALYLISLLAPAAIILLVSLAVYRSVWDWHSGWLGLLLSLAVTISATNIVKITVGRPRPDFIDRCQPPPGLSNPTPYTLSTSSICTREDLLTDGFRSFPSGHASMSASGLIYLTLYLAGKMHIYNQKGMSVKTWILLAPISGAVLVAVSRSMDYRHHATDIIAGSVLGTVVSIYCYHQYYPSLSHPVCHKPFSPRVPAEDQESDHELREQGGTSSDLERGTLVGGEEDADGVRLIDGVPQR